ncbi:hypothetical protein NJH24_23865 [Pseudomonas asiatica]|uniref:hypothetical protein n=1 Tax=Pseudomonas asiatica TaxID=2219225 RepID=UPI00209AD112|nr:hypothetical protein [Pseudomonas asiatica]MCO7537805.1 hypothetical protein [Pseudomonas asiatica]MCO7551701.1 hypothetical protein [Pseudomonas asiatica]MCO7562488.1 hypothetical protein [Pseudomonas asiatica]
MTSKELLEGLTVHRLGPNDVLVIPEYFEPDHLEELRNALEQLKSLPGLIVIGDVQRLHESDMNAAGWYRK